MKINLYKIPAGHSAGHSELTLISHIDPDADERAEDPTIDMLPGSGYAEDLGEWEFDVDPPRGPITIGETKYGEPGIFVSDTLYLPRASGRNGNIVLVDAARPNFRPDWIFGVKKMNQIA